MPREILLQIINEKLIFYFIAILITYFVVIWVIFKLSFQMLDIKIKTKQIWGGILLVVFYNLVGKLIFQNDLIFILVSIVILTILMKAIGREKVTWMRAFWAIFIAIAADFIGAMVILTPLSLIPAIAKLKLTPPAAVFGSACEGVLPAILLFLLKTLKISIIPPVKRRISSLDIGNLIIFVIPFIWFDQDFMRTFKNLEKYNQLELLGEFLFQLFLAGGLIITYYWVYTTTNRRHEMELEFEKKQSEEAQRRYDEDRRRHEEEQRLNQEKIAALNTQNDELKRMNEHLNNLTSKPQMVIDDIAKLIKSNMEISEKLQEYQESLSDYVVIKPNALVGYNLTVNEKVVLDGIIEGKTSQEIADISYLAEGSVRNISRKLYKKFGVRNKDDLVKLIAEKSSK